MPNGVATICSDRSMCGMSSEDLTLRRAEHARIQMICFGEDSRLAVPVHEGHPPALVVCSVLA